MAFHAPLQKENKIKNLIIIHKPHLIELNVNKPFSVLINTLASIPSIVLQNTKYYRVCRLKFREFKWLYHKNNAYLTKGQKSQNASYVGAAVLVFFFLKKNRKQTSE